MSDSILDAAVEHQRAGRFEQAAELYRTILRHQPNHPDALHLLGLTIAHMGKPAEGAELIRRAIAIRPGSARYYLNLGYVFRLAGRTDDSAASFQNAVHADPDYAEAHHNLALALADEGRISQAIECEERACALAPQVAACASGKIFMRHFDPAALRALLLREMRGFDEKFATHLPAVTPPVSDRNPDRKLRIGYVSPDFYHQAESFFMLPLLRAHDRANFEIHCFSSVRKPDEITAQFRKYSAGWHDSLADSDEQLAARIRAAEIDILVDLTMHMRDNRLLVFARKPAPVQVTWLAYPGGTGLRAIDYRLTDARLDPEVSDQYYVETSIRLPECWCCYDPLSKTAIEPVDKDFTRYGSLNNPAKLNAITLDLWAHVLRADPGSRLLLMTKSENHQLRIRDFFREREIAEDRIEFTPFLPRRQYLKLHNQIDVCLDPIPYNGITTTLDALWMGVPVVTLPATTAPSRAGLSILSAAGFPEFVADSPSSFAQIATRKPGPPREQIRQRLMRSPIMDAPRFARHIENAYRQMWRAFVSAGSSNPAPQP
jgi:protein O-GlcNAc transferase